ncbi:MAG: hypothetical protein JO126_05675 [Alphaproteobacteria bacterium]|nr:hypothetical protein [Alphaproteobacteria bacterium]MBV8548927.1 hypothetical protein [Alphaproteobacteria bacterium]
MCALFGVAAMAALAGVVTLAMTTPLGAMMTGLNGPGLALAWFAALFCVSTVGVSWGANTLFWLMMKPSNTKGGLTGFLGGMGWIANMLSLPPKLDA